MASYALTHQLTLQQFRVQALLHPHSIIVKSRNQAVVQSLVETKCSRKP